VSDSPQIDILRRKARPAQTRRVRDGAGDVWRRVLPRAAADGMGLELAVSRFEERSLDLHEELSVEEGALLLLLVEDGGSPAGLAVLDPSLLVGLIEMQTTGRVSSGRRDPRRPTAVDAALARHALDGWLSGVADARGEARWLTGASVPDLRTALLKLEEGRWTETRVDLDLCSGKRSGRLQLFRPVPVAAVTHPAEPEGLQAVLLPVETRLEAVLCRVRIPLGTVVSLSPGELVPLQGVSLRSIRLEAPVGRLVAQVHLGQSRGYRAVRILRDGAPDVTSDARRLDEDAETRGLLPDLALPDEAAVVPPLPVPGA
jgi:flagellar motor switch protein FliM